MPVKNVLQIDPKIIETNRRKLTGLADFAPKLLEALNLLDREQKQAQLVGDEQAVDAQLYAGFFNDTDRAGMRSVRVLIPMNSTVSDRASATTA